MDDEQHFFKDVAYHNSLLVQPRIKEWTKASRLALHFHSTCFDIVHLDSDAYYRVGVNKKAHVVSKVGSVNNCRSLVDY